MLIHIMESICTQACKGMVYFVLTLTHEAETLSLQNGREN